MKISIIIPTYNEEDNIANLINKIANNVNLGYELVIIDDYSTDSTYRLVEELSRQYTTIKLVRNNQEPGFANAIITGFNSSNTEVVVPLMADLCDDLSTIKKMLDKMNEGYDIVCGSRYIKGGVRLGGSKIKGFFSYFVGRSLSYLLGLPTTDITNAFKMYKKKVIDRIDIRSNGFEISMEIPLKAYYLGYKITEVPTVWRERTKGKSSFRIFKLMPAYLKLYLWAIFKKITK